MHELKGSDRSSSQIDKDIMVQNGNDSKPVDRNTEKKKTQISKTGDRNQQLQYYFPQETSTRQEFKIR